MSHQYIFFSKKGLSNNELNELEKIYLEIEINLTKFNKIKTNNKDIKNKIKNIELKIFMKNTFLNLIMYIKYKKFGKIIY